MTAPKFKVGDKVRRKPDQINVNDWNLGTGPLVVKSVGMDNLHVVGDGRSWSSRYFEHVAAPTLEEELIAARSEVKRLEAEIKAANAPKVGEWRVSITNNQRGKVVHVGKTRCCIEVGNELFTPYLCDVPGYWKKDVC